ncbi:MAG: AAC(3) family N-acetyltransferase [Eubacterium sp.]|nr:AAC(3) family N-acetyltransferase [Eubacterium sp.]
MNKEFDHANDGLDERRVYVEIEGIEIHSERFDDIVEDIKQRNLSRNNMSKLIIGTGLSILYGIPGMKELAEHLDKEIDKKK